MPSFPTGRKEFASHFTSAFHAGVRTRHKIREEELSWKQRETEQAYYTVLDFERDKPVQDRQTTKESFDSGSWTV